MSCWPPSCTCRARGRDSCPAPAWQRHSVRGWRGLVQRAQGRLDAAAATYQQALEITTPPGRPALPAAGIAYVGLAEVAYQRDELSAALREVTEGVAACRQFPYAQPLATGLATLAWIRQASGDPGALDAIDQAGLVAPGPAVGLLNPVPAQRARLLLARGEVAAVARWIQEHGLGPDDEWTDPVRHSRCWTECLRRRTPKTGRAASSRSRRCGHWRWRPPTRRPAR